MKKSGNRSVVDLYSVASFVAETETKSGIFRNQNGNNHLIANEFANFAKRARFVLIRHFFANFRCKNDVGRHIFVATSFYLKSSVQKLQISI